MYINTQDMKSMDENHKKLNKSRDQNSRQFWGYFLDFRNLWWKSQTSVNPWQPKAADTI
jgi:hypothetical protein